ncbi:unnamed protein product [Penicillium crustosum]
MTGRKNVLLMVADDLGKQLGCYGASTIKTPNLDNLAAEGLHTHQNGQYGLASHRHHFVTFDHVETAPQLLNQSGYRTGILGKIHVGPAPVYPWEVAKESETRDVAVIADQANEFFQESLVDERPFFLTIGFHDPHRDRTRGGFGNDQEYDPRITKGTYTSDAVEIPSFINDSPGARFELAEYYNSIHRLDQGIGFVLKALENAGLAESTLVIFISDNGPPFINSKTTLFDAGVRLPLIIKHPKLRPAVNSDMVSYVDILPTLLDYAGHPGVVDPAKKRLGNSLLPILGTDAKPSEWNQVFGSHTFHEVTNYWPTRFIRDRRYKYHRNLAWRLDFPFAADIYGSLSWEDIRNSSDSEIMIGERKLKDYFFRAPEELYDLENDPNEVNNLVKDPEHAAVLEDLRTRLETWQRRTEDPWLYRDGVSTWFVRYHFPAGLKIPDRLDFDAEQPGNQNQKAFVGNVPWGADVDQVKNTVA